VAKLEVEVEGHHGKKEVIEGEEEGLVKDKGNEEEETQDTGDHEKEEVEVLVFLVRLLVSQKSQMFLSWHLLLLHVLQFQL